MLVREHEPRAVPRTDVLVRTQKPRRLRRTAAGVPAGVTAVTAGYSQLDDRFSFLPHLPKIHVPNPFGGPKDLPPPQATAEVRHDTYETEADLNVLCKGKVSVGVNVHGVKQETWGKGVFDKVVFGDFLLCGNTGEVLAHAKITTDENGKILKVVVQTPGLEVTQPRVNFKDDRNCPDTDTKDDDKKLQKKINDVRTARAKNKKVECEDGFKVEAGIQKFAGWGGDDLANVITTAHAAAQIAMELDAQPSEIIDRMNVGFLEDLRSILEAKYKGAEIVINPVDEVQAARDRLTRFSEDEKQKGNYNVIFGLNEGKPEVVVESPNFGKVTVKVRSVAMEQAVIDRINQQNTTEPSLVTTTTTVVNPNTSTSAVNSRNQMQSTTSTTFAPNRRAQVREQSMNSKVRGSQVMGQGTRNIRA